MRISDWSSDVCSSDLFGSLARRRGAQALALGYDGRSSSPLLAQALGAGLAACGLKVLPVGRGPTPILYFAAYTDACGMAVDGGVMITGSHKQPDNNGFQQFGRASGRARVCQYVMIPGVAGTLKKKK